MPRDEAAQMGTRSVIGAIEPGGRTAQASPGIAKRIAALAMLGVLLAFAFSFDNSHEAQAAISRSLSAFARAQAAQGGLVPLATAAFASGLWVVSVIVRVLAFYGAFLIAELILIGRPKIWRLVWFGIYVQLFLVVFQQLSAPLFGVVLPSPPTWGPLVSIEQAWFTGPLAPFAPILLALASLMVFSFMFYWVHRAQHAIPILWRFHSVHHSVEEMDAMISYVHPVDAVGHRIGQIMVASLVGFNYETVALILAFQNIHDIFIHTRAPINFGFLGRVFVDNRYHFVHHTIHESKSGKNFSTWFTLFDHMFGTYHPPYSATLGPTGLEDKLPPKTLQQFVLAKLDTRPPSA